ncbi:septal ring lytic transglycosylase RlpA family protein [Neisseriaceae bacterium PsAf]|nr:septal ring lytic transglycosylase RlpA family protein [Neisseriaceae bacterium PsAf]
MKALKILAFLVASMLLIHYSLASTLDSQVFSKVIDSVTNNSTIDEDSLNRPLNFQQTDVSIIKDKQLVDDILTNNTASKLEKEQVVKSEQTGLASWYGKTFHGRRTASGEVYDMYKMTAAHKKLPLNTKIRVTNLKNNKSVTLKVNDRGPYIGKRILDVSYAAAQELGFVSKGVAKVKVEILK